MRRGNSAGGRWPGRIILTASVLAILDSGTVEGVVGSLERVLQNAWRSAETHLYSPLAFLVVPLFAVFLVLAPLVLRWPSRARVRTVARLNRAVITGGVSMFLLVVLWSFTGTGLDVPRTPHPEPDRFSTPAPERKAPPGLEWVSDFSCNGTEEALRRAAPAVVGEEMFTAWRYFGPNEIGCPLGGVDRRNGVYLAELVGGESDPSLIVGDSTGRAAVVFEPYASAVLREWRRGTLSGVGERTPHGTGDHQIVHLEEARCLLVARPFLSDPPIRLPAAATALVLREATERMAYPVVLGQQTDARGTRFVVSFQGTDREEVEAVVVVRGDRAWLQSEPESRVGPQDAACPDTGVLDALAGRHAAMAL